MKKLSAAALTLSSFLASAAPVFAQVDVGIKAPTVGINPITPIGTVLSNGLIVVFVIAALLVLFFLVWGAFDWITSGGDKEKVGGARKKIFAAIIGLVLLALAFLITRVAGQIVNIDILNLKQIPTLQSCQGADLVFDPQRQTCVPKPAIPSAPQGPQ